jgi:periplasmic protein TonB
MLALLKRLSTLQIAFGISILLHAALLTIRFVDPERFKRVFEDTPLEVVLVNSKSDEAPLKAAAIAQANLAGGGDAEQGRAASPLPSSALNQMGDSPEEALRKVDAMQKQQTVLLTQVRSLLANLPAPDPQRPSTDAADQAQEQKRMQLMKMLAEIEARIQEENAKPKKRYISPATREAAYAIYYDALRRKIEKIGTENFPEFMGKKLYGELTALITVHHDGSLVDVEVVDGSGNPTLDRRARTIAQHAAPFGKFTKTMRKQSDQIVVAARFKFTRDGALETQLSGR